MTFKSPLQPFCRYCGEPIRKYTTNVHVKRERTECHRNDLGSRYIYPDRDLKSKAECQSFTNQVVVSVAYTTDLKDGDPVPGTRRVSSFTEWDGERYQDQFFCSGEHAKNFGYVLARQTSYAMQPYHDAIAKQKTTKETV